jgi:hypothetical protein
MTMRTFTTALIVSALLAACGGSGSHKRKPARSHATTVASVRPIAPPAAARLASPPPEQAFVTAETENRLLVVDLPKLM